MHNLLNESLWLKSMHQVSADFDTRVLMQKYYMPFISVFNFDSLFLFETAWLNGLHLWLQHQRSGVQNLGVHTVSFHLSHIHLSLFGPFPFSYLKLYQNDPRNSQKFIDKCARTGKTWRKGVQLRKNWSVPKPDHFEVMHFN